MTAHEHATAHRRVHRWKDEWVIAVIAAIMSAALVYVFGGNLLEAVTMSLGIGVLAYGAASLQTYRKRHDIYLKRRKSHARP